MAIHLYKTSNPSTRTRTEDSQVKSKQVKSNLRNNLISGQHACGKGRNARGIITAGHRGEVISAYIVKSTFDGMKKTYMVES